MAEKVKVWFDPEADFLEVRFSDAPGFNCHRPPNPVIPAESDCGAPGELLRTI